MCILEYLVHEIVDLMILQSWQVQIFYIPVEFPVIDKVTIEFRVPITTAIEV